MHRDLHLPDRLTLERCPWAGMLPLTVMLLSHDPVNVSHHRGVSKSERNIFYDYCFFSKVKEEVEFSPKQLYHSQEKTAFK